MPAKGVKVPDGHGIRAFGIRLSRGDNPPIPVLGGVNLHAAAGQVTSIVGPSGCGKSTLLDVLAGLIPPDDGHVEGGGDMVLMPQRDALLPWRTLDENVALGAVLSGETPRDATGRARATLARLGLTGFGAHFPHALSGGMRQRGALARTLLSGRRTWLLDEPFGALDALTRADMHQVLLDIHAEHEPTLLLVTHDIREAVTLSHRVLVASPRPMRITHEIEVDAADRDGAAVQVLHALRMAAGVA
jgi:ABC-type nitrate/sulfonate/bicarbonate transport system ATPase subunit